VVVRHALARPEVEIVACVRSARAASELPPIPSGRGSVAHIAFDAPESLRRALRGSAAVIHLAGVLIEKPGVSYRAANVDTLAATLEAALGERVDRLVLVGAVGADPTSENPYFRSKGEAEQLLIHGGLAYTILRAPLVLGCASEGTRAFARETAGGFVPLIGGGRSLEQPIDAHDLAAGALNAAADPTRARDRVLDLVGPESLPMSEIVRRGARIRGTRPRVVPVPAGVLKIVLRLMRRLVPASLSPDVIDVMQTDVRLDPKPAAEVLGIRLTPLDDTIRRSLEIAGAS
jgi:NADH dehydrogenase